MSKIIYVGNLPADATHDQLRDLFSPYGTVTEVRLKTDQDTGTPRGFGFDEMETGAESAISAIDRQDFGGCSLNVREARLRPAKSPRSARRTGGSGNAPGATN